MVNAVCGQGYDSCSTRIGAVEFGFAVSFPLLFPLFMFFCLHRKSIFGEEFLTNVANRSRSSYNAAQSALQGSHNFRRRQSHAPAATAEPTVQIELSNVIPSTSASAEDGETGVVFSIQHNKSSRSVACDPANTAAGSLLTLESIRKSLFIEDNSGRWKLKQKPSKSPKIYLSVFGGQLSIGSLLVLSDKASAVKFTEINGLLRVVKNNNPTKFYVKSASNESGCFMMLADKNNDAGHHEQHFTIVPAF